jgi:hypothetical protein
MKMVFVARETEHDKRTAPRPELFVTARRLQEQRPQPERTVLGSSHGEDVFCTLETNDTRTTWIRPTLFVSVRRIKEQSSPTLKGCLEFEFQ